MWKAISSPRIPSSLSCTHAAYRSIPADEYAASIASTAVARSAAPRSRSSSALL
jgi:hypothetical protein